MDADSKIKYFKSVKWSHGVSNTFLKYKVLSGAKYRQKTKCKNMDREINFISTKVEIKLSVLFWATY